MTRVHVMVEGQTEETFVRELLYDHLQHRGLFLNPILLRTSAQGKGGVVSYAKVRPQLIRQCRQDAMATVTTMIDLYRLPGDFPGQQGCAGQWSVRINAQWRLCFRFSDGDAVDVEIVDYH